MVATRSQAVAASAAAPASTARRGGGGVSPGESIRVKVTPWLSHGQVRHSWPGVDGGATSLSLRPDDPGSAGGERGSKGWGSAIALPSRGAHRGRVDGQG